MKRVSLILLILGSMAITSLLIACGSSAEPTPTAVPPTAVPTPADKSEVPRVMAEELKKRLDDGEDILVIDTRSKIEYDLRHLPGAITRPDSYDDVAHDQEIVAYCT